VNQAAGADRAPHAPTGPPEARPDAGGGPDTGSGLAARIRLRRGALDLDLSLRVQDGETVALLGPNGAGKTTALRALCGLTALDAGRITLDGAVLEDPAAGIRLPPQSRRCGVVFQDLMLFPHLSALDNVAFPLRMRRTGRRGGERADGRGPAPHHADGARRTRLAHAWLERVGLVEEAALRPPQLSGGQRQRLALARALAAEPRLLLLDEPLAAVDAGARAELRRDLRRHLAEHRGVRLLVTHEPLEAYALADRMVIVEAGHVVQEGSVAEVTARPRSAYVADMVGLNLLRGTAGDGGVQVGAVHLVLPEPGRGEVFVAVHPRAVALHPRAPHATSSPPRWARSTSRAAGPGSG
jgi:molybdate transport system ATP-binding protein